MTQSVQNQRYEVYEQIIEVIDRFQKHEISFKVLVDALNLFIKQLQMLLDDRVEEAHDWWLALRAIDNDLKDGNATITSPEYVSTISEIIEHFKKFFMTNGRKHQNLLRCKYMRDVLIHYTNSQIDFYKLIGRLGRAVQSLELPFEFANDILVHWNTIEAIYDSAMSSEPPTIQETDRTILKDTVEHLKDLTTRLSEDI